MDTRFLLLGGLGWFLFKGDNEASPPPGFVPAPGDGGFAGGSTPTATAAPQYGVDGGATQRRYDEGVPGAQTWRYLSDTVTVLLPPWWGVRGCCGAWATATPSVRGARHGGGEMYSPRHGNSRACQCKVPGQGGRPWWQPIEAVARRGNAPDTEVTPADATRWHIAGEGAGSPREVKGFVHEGTAWLVTSEARTWSEIHDANPDVVYLVSVRGRAAYHIPTGRNVAPNDWQPRWNGEPCPPNPNPWDVEPWRGWMMGRGKRGQTPLEADRSDGVLKLDFVAPPCMAAFLAKPVMFLPFSPKSPETRMKKPAKKASGGKKGA